MYGESISLASWCHILKERPQLPLLGGELRQAWGSASREMVCIPRKLYHLAALYSNPATPPGH